MKRPGGETPRNPELPVKKSYQILLVCNMQFSELNSKPHGVNSLITIIDSSIGAHLYPTPGSEHYELLCLYQFHGPSNINCEQEKKIEIIIMEISNVRNINMNTRANKI